MERASRAPFDETGVELAVEAMRTWSDAPAAVAPMLTGLITDPSPQVRTAAIRAPAGQP